MPTLRPAWALAHLLDALTSGETPPPLVARRRLRLATTGHQPRTGHAGQSRASRLVFGLSGRPAVFVPALPPGQRALEPPAPSSGPNVSQTEGHRTDCVRLLKKRGGHCVVAPCVALKDGRHLSTNHLRHSSSRLRPANQRTAFLPPVRLCAVTQRPLWAKNRPPHRSSVGNIQNRRQAGSLDAESASQPSNTPSTTLIRKLPLHDAEPPPDHAAICTELAKLPSGKPLCSPRPGRNDVQGSTKRNSFSTKKKGKIKLQNANRGRNARLCSSTRLHAPHTWLSHTGRLDFIAPISRALSRQKFCLSAERTTGSRTISAVL